MHVELVVITSSCKICKFITQKSYGTLINLEAYLGEMLNDLEIMTEIYVFV